LTPDQLVLGSGGVLGDTWMSGVVAGLLEAGGADLRQCRRFVGTSAGSIVATRLAAGQDMRTYLARRFEGPDPADIELIDGEADGLHSATGGDPSVRDRIASAALGAIGPGGRLLRRSLLRLVPEGKRELSHLGTSIDNLMPDWDPRLSLIGLSVESGGRVVIEASRSRGLRPSEAVRGSCAIPGVFRPVDSEEGRIVDGGVWSPVNLDAVLPAAGSRVLCLYPSGYPSTSRSLRRTVTGAVSRTRVRVETAAVRHHGARVLTVTPDTRSAEAIGPDRMDSDRDPAVAAAGFRQGAELASPLKAWL
jgi:NTE family protein